MGGPGETVGGPGKWIGLEFGPNSRIYYVFLFPLLFSQFYSKLIQNLLKFDPFEFLSSPILFEQTQEVHLTSGTQTLLKILI